MKMASTATVPIDEQKIKHLKSFERHLRNSETPDAFKIELWRNSLQSAKLVSVLRGIVKVGYFDQNIKLIFYGVL